MKLEYGTMCDKCKNRITKGFVHRVELGNDKYDLCDECNWDLKRWINTEPLQFGDEKLEVK